MEAELAAAVNAVHMAIQKGIAKRGDVVLLQSDCLSIFPMIEERIPPKTENEILAREKLVYWREALEIKVRVRHVKGHTRGMTPRTWVNNTCDKTARLHMENARRRGRRRR